MTDKHPYLDKFLSEGGASLTDKEYIALLLSYCGRLAPEMAADELLGIYSGFTAVTDADPRLISRTLSSDDAAVLFRLISRLSALYVSEENDILCLKSSHDAMLYFSGIFTGVTEERMVIAAADRAFRITAIKTVYSGSPLGVNVVCRDIADFVVAVRAERVFLAHNHPIGSPEPSEDDIRATEKIIAALSRLGTALTDHVIIGRDGAYSMRSSGVCGELNRQAAFGYKI